MQKKYIVRLTDEERHEVEQVVKKLKGTSQKVCRAQILLKADVDGTNWTDRQIAEAFGCRIQTVENIRQRLWNGDLPRRFLAANGLSRRSKSYSTENRRLRSSPRATDHRPRVMPTGRSGCWPAKSSSWGLSMR
jgi:hypothetical protein